VQSRPRRVTFSGSHVGDIHLLCACDRAALDVDDVLGEAELARDTAHAHPIGATGAVLATRLGGASPPRYHIEDASPR
jgi:hypothetical protein